MANDAFRANFSKLMKNAGARTDEVVRRTMIGLGSKLIEKSPVDTGRFKNNWMPGDGAVNTTTTTEVDTTGAIALARITAGARAFKMGGTFYIANSLPYARRLEYGWSKQAPQGFVRLTVLEFKADVARAAESMK